MIVAVSLNPALDLTYEVDALAPGETNRVRCVHTRAGGKGVNVARVLAAMGHGVQLLGFIGGATGASLVDELTGDGLSQGWVSVGSETRRTVVVWDRGADEVTSLNEPGPEVSPAEWAALVDALRDVATADAVVLSGSLPPGLPATAFGELVTVAAAHGALVVLDTDGLGLVPAVRAAPDIVKPNRAELAAATGVVVHDAASARLAADKLCELGARSVVASLGRDGVVGVTAEGAWHARPAAIDGNATGAGDACVAGLVIGGLEQRTWPERLRLAAAMGAVAATSPVAGVAAADRIRACLESTTVEEM